MNSSSRSRPPNRDGPPPEATADALDAAREGSLIEQSRAGLTRSDHREWTSVIFGLTAFALACITLLLAEPPHLSAHIWALIGVGVVVYAVASSIEFEIGSASAVPTEPVLVAMLLLIPPSLVPLCVVAGLALSSVVIEARTGRHEPWLVTACSSFHSVGPAAVVIMFGPSGSDAHMWWLLLWILVAQMICDLTIAAVRTCYGLGLPFRELMAMVRWSYSVDATLAPTGLLAAMALGSSPGAFLPTLFIIALLSILANDRRRQIDRLVALGSAYDHAETRARRDALTGLKNRLAWMEASSEAAATNDPTAVVLLDVDRLKLVNDRFGHDAGDQLLQVIGGIIAEETPPGATACRIGGDEFAILLRGALAGTRESVGRAIATRVSSHPPVCDVPMSVSVGTAVGVGHVVQDTIGAADEELYRNKRNRPTLGVRPDQTAAHP